MTSPQTPHELLQRALDADPARPMLTFYDDATGERAELSVATYANWVAKTANLLVDELGTQPGDRIALRLPCHWQAAVWLGACWAAGAVAAPGAAEAEVAVVALDDPAPSPAAGEVVGLGLGTLGLPRRDAPQHPDVTVDYDRVVLGHGDRFAGAAPPAAAPALQLTTHGGSPEGGSVTAGELARQASDAAERWALGQGERVLVAGPLEDMTTVLAAALVPLVDRVGAVLFRYPVEDHAAARLAAEHVVAAAGIVTRPIRGIRPL